jgi:hypothetical protein
VFEKVVRLAVMSQELGNLAAQFFILAALRQDEGFALGGGCDFRRTQKHALGSFVVGAHGCDSARGVSLLSSATKR